MNGRKARGIRKAQAACDHVKQTGLTRHPNQVMFDRCKDCGIRFGVLVPERRANPKAPRGLDPRREAHNKAKAARDVREDQRSLDRAQRRLDRTRRLQLARWGALGAHNRGIGLDRVYGSRAA